MGRGLWAGSEGSGDLGLAPGALVNPSPSPATQGLAQDTQVSRTELIGAGDGTPAGPPKTLRCSGPSPGAQEGKGGPHTRLVLGWAEWEGPLPRQ